MTRLLNILLLTEVCVCAGCVSFRNAPAESSVRWRSELAGEWLAYGAEEVEAPVRIRVRIAGDRLECEDLQAGDHAAFTVRGIRAERGMLLLLQQDSRPGWFVLRLQQAADAGGYDVLTISTKAIESALASGDLEGDPVTLFGRTVTYEITSQAVQVERFLICHSEGWSVVGRIVRAEPGATDNPDSAQGEAEKSSSN
jgi:hypothetical protein